MDVWLREKQVGARWVFPVINEESGTVRITLVISVGTIADERVSPINADNIAVNVFDNSGVALEQLARPEAGNLAIRGGPSLQSTAAFTFAASPSPLKVVEARISGDIATFEVRVRRRQLKLPLDVPEPHDDFPLQPVAEDVLGRILQAIQSFLRGIGKFFKQFFADKCCINSFNCPDNRVTGVKNDRFEMNANFQASGGDCSCPCCEYRQYVRGAFRDAAGQAVPFALPDGPFSETDYREDGIPNHWGAGQHDFYGHREQKRHANDDYLPKPADGCQYRGKDTVTCSANNTVHAEFIGMIVDVCRGEIVSVKTWVVNL